MDAFTRLSMLARPKLPADILLDTDTFNEVDDQFALAYLLRCETQLRIQAITAAPFFNENSESPADGMKKSYAEIRRILSLAGREDLFPQVFPGSETYLPDEKTPVPSPAADRICTIGMEYSSERPLYVVAIGAITNVASALIRKPELKERIVVVLAGRPRARLAGLPRIQHDAGCRRSPGGIRMRRPVGTAALHGRRLLLRRQ